jgi:hypothetical protein
MSSTNIYINIFQQYPQIFVNNINLIYYSHVNYSLSLFPDELSITTTFVNNLSTFLLFVFLPFFDISSYLCLHSFLKSRIWFISNGWLEDLQNKINIVNLVSILKETSPKDVNTRLKIWKTQTQNFHRAAIPLHYNVKLRVYGVQLVYTMV